MQYEQVTFLKISARLPTHSGGDMKKQIFLAGLFMSFFGFGLAGLVLYFIYDGTVEEVVSVKAQLVDLDIRIDKMKAALAAKPDDLKTRHALEKTSMERVLLPQLWFLQMEMVEKGVINFIFHAFASPEARREKLRNRVLERAGATDISACPEKFQKLFRFYASPTGYGIGTLSKLRDFANSYEITDNTSEPDQSQAE